MEPTERQHLMDARAGARSYTGSLWQEGAGWITLPAPGLGLQAIELAAESNHYCHAQKGPGSHFDPKKEQARRQLFVASAICLVFMIGEVIGGYLAHSLAVMTDAAHLLTDFASMLVSLFSLWMSSRPATKTMNFGWQRAEILGALLSVLSIWVVTGVLVFLAVERLISGDYEVEGGTMLITSGCAVAVNIISGIFVARFSLALELTPFSCGAMDQSQNGPDSSPVWPQAQPRHQPAAGEPQCPSCLYPCGWRLSAELRHLGGSLYFILQARVQVCRPHLHLPLLHPGLGDNLDHPERCDPGADGRDPQGGGLHGCTGSAAVRGRGGSLTQPAYLGADRVPARAVCPHRHRSECRRPGRAEGSQHLPAGKVPLPHHDHPD
ncbi:zinc transporter 2 isoform X1 [Suricata suricatta]|uniref:Cation efflux protein transmembrane domain-containing protein n=1 Tax=Suricata suricatta TaxID=37032 RepID=A0A673UTM2_SURSU|nr:zinc transporter 2 isoform X1 [Suricata suricatta]